MKKNQAAAFLMLILLALWSSCSKDGPAKSSIATPDKSTNNTTSSGPITPMNVYLSNGQYFCSFGGGIDFGSSFPYPLTVYSYQNYTLYTPGVTTATPIYNAQLVAENAVLYCIIKGPYITVVQATFGANITNSINSYTQALGTYETTQSNLENTINTDQTTATSWENKAAQSPSNSAYSDSANKYQNLANNAFTQLSNLVAPTFPTTAGATVSLYGAFVLYNGSPTNVAIIPTSQIPKNPSPDQ